MNLKQSAWLALLLLTAGLTGPRADTPERCIRLTETAATPIRSLPARERRAARATLSAAGEAARNDGNTARPFLIRLPSSEAGSSHLIAYVPASAERPAVLVYHSTALRLTRTLVGASPFLSAGMHEPSWETGTETEGFSYRFPNAKGPQMVVSETVTYPLEGARGAGARLLAVSIKEESGSNRMPRGCR